jgi:cytochrome b subunit of formate dehydrogenase
MLKEEFQLIKEAKKDLRKFGLTLGIALAAISAALFYFEKSSAIYFLIIGVILLLAALFIPQILKPVNRIWMGLAIVLGFVMSRVILTILFYLVLTPLAILARITGKKFIERKYNVSAETYWEKRSVIHKKPIDYERQF